MNFALFFTFLSKIIFCIDETTAIWKKIDKNTLDIELNEIDNKISVSIISEEYFPLLGSWNAGETHIKLDQFYINGLNILTWVYKNITTKKKLNAYLEESDDYSFNFMTEKDEFVRKDNLECKLRLIKKEDFEKIMIEYFLYKASLTFPDEYSVIKELAERLKKMLEHEVIYGIKFNNISDEMPDLNEYELGVYVPEVKNETQIKQETLVTENSLKRKIKQTAIDIGKHTLISLGIFGPYAFFIFYAISKYLIK